MVFSLSSRRRWQFAGALALLAFVYLLLIAKQFASSVFASSPELPNLKRAVLFSPGNADYRHRLGRYYAFVGADPQAAIENFRAAVARNPHDAHYWLDLAAAYQVTGYAEGQRSALDRALKAEPTSPKIAWEAANFFLIDGEIDRALKEFRVVIDNDNTLVEPALQSCWRVRPDTDALLRDVIPPKPDSLLSFLNLLRSKKETDASIKVWRRLADLHEKFPIPHAFQYVRYLIDEHRPEAAMTAWEQTADVLGLSAYLPSQDNLVVNGDFSLDLLNGGFDWNYVNRAGVRPLLDPSDFREGHRSLSLTFEGPGISDAGIGQMIPVHGGTTYDFSAFYKSAEFQGAGGPQIVLRDAYSGAPLWASDPLNDADFWKEVHSQVTTPDTTSLLVLAIERFPAGSPIRGKLWLDDFELAPADSTPKSGQQQSDQSSSEQDSSDQDSSDPVRKNQVPPNQDHPDNNQ